MKSFSQRVREKLWVHWQGRLYQVPFDLRKSQGGARAEESQELVAPFSCKVLKLHVKSGQVIKKGDPVVVVEAMKMEYSYASPRDGAIAQVLVKEGEIVQGGAPFVRWKE